MVKDFPICAISTNFLLAQEQEGRIIIDYLISFQISLLVWSVAVMSVLCMVMNLKVLKSEP